MTIERNKITEVEHELTWTEMRAVYDAMRREYLKEDIENKAEEMELELTDEEMETIIDLALDGLEKNDSYWECYWETIEYAIENKDTEMIL